jgi:hypothetical protein
MFEIYLTKGEKEKKKNERKKEERERRKYDFEIWKQ